MRGVVLPLVCAISQALLAWACAFWSVTTWSHAEGMGLPIAQFSFFVQASLFLMPAIPAAAGVFFVAAAIRRRLSVSLLVIVLVVEALGLAATVTALCMPYNAITYAKRCPAAA